jgi:two-component system, NarL family, response regulator NreC
LPIRIVLADDHTLVRQSVRSLLEGENFQIVGEASDGQELIHLTAKQNPDVALIDINMPMLNGISAARELTSVSPNTKNILLTLHDDNRYLIEALAAGVKGYVLKSQAGRDLVHAIRSVYRGEVYLSPGLSSALVDAFLSKSDVPGETISPRERMVLQLIADGKSTKDIAALLGISVKTADSYRSRLMRKLDIHEVASLVRYAIRNGVIQL